MTKKIIFLFLMIVFGTNLFVNAQGTITIGTGTAANSTTVHPTPYGTYYKNHRVQYMYLASELAAAGLVSGNITAIAFNVSNLNLCSSMPNFTIKAKQTTASALTTTFDPAGYTTVWTNVDFLPTTGWNTHTLSTPILWDGTSNLLIDICFSLIPGVYTENASVFYTTTTGNLASSYRSDSEVACGTALAATLPATSDRANIKITGQVATCLPPTNISAGSLTPTSSNMSWTAGGTEALWDIYYGTTASITVPNASTTPTVSGLTAANYNISGLTTLTNYTFYVRANCGGGDKSLWAGPFNFTTPSSLLSGTYTINKTQPTAGNNYNSFTEFATAINTGGFGGPVVVNVVAGTGPYTEQVSIGQPVNSSATNTLTINGNGNTLEYLSTNTNERATLKFNGTDYVTVNNLIVKSLGTTTSQYGFTVQLMNGANYNTFNNCQFIADIASTSTNYTPFVTSNSATVATTAALAASNLTVTNCIIVGGYYGMVINGPTTTPFSTNNNISNNEIKDFYLYGIYTRGQDNSVFSGNNIHRTNRTVSSTTYMFYLNSNISNTSITKNKIYNIAGSGATTSAAYGIYATSITSPANQGVLISNNAIYGLSLMNGIQYGIYLSTTGYAKVYHNSVSMDNLTHTGASAIYCFYHTGAAANLDIKNNVFSYTTNSTGAKYNMYFATNTAVVSSDYNVLYKGATAGTNNTGYWNTLAYLNLSNWQTANGGIYDLQSTSINPDFTSPSFLKPSSASVNDIGTDLLSVVPDDILGVSRTSTPDPGAYEFTPTPMSVDSVNVIQPLISSVAPGSVNNLMLRVGVYTQNSLSPLSFNGITFSTNGSSNANNDIANAKLWSSGSNLNFSSATQIGDVSLNPNGTFVVNNGTGLPLTLAPGVNYFWVTYDLTSSASDLNILDAEFVDVNVGGNNYSPLNGAPAGSRTIRVFNGIYTVGTAGDFPSLSSVFTDINNLGLAGNVTLNIISDITETSMVTLNQWAPAGNSFTLLIQPSGGARTISGSVATALIKLNGADRVTINGLNTAGNSLTFQNTSTAASTAVFWLASLGQLDTAATYNTLKNLTIIGGSNTVTSQFGVYAGGTTVSTTGAGKDNDYLTVEGNNISNVYYGIYTRGNGAPNQTDYLLIKNNNISNYGLTGVHCFFANSPVFQGNNLSSTITNTGTKYGLNIQNSTNDILVSKNKIYMSAGTSMHGINLTNDTSTVSNPGYIWNNFISLQGATSQCYGIRDIASHYNFVLNNSININGSNATETRGINIATGSTNVQVFNNTVLSNKYPIFYELTAGALTVTASNYNNFFTTGTGNQFVYGSTATSFATLADMIASPGYNGMDANSISVDPIYTSTSDLHIDNIQLYSKGTSLPYVTDDIDGDARATIPCIGADEFIIPSNDLTVKAVYTLGKLPIQGGAPHNVKAIIRNRGLAAQSNINVSLNISGANTFTTTYNIASIAPGAEDTISFNGFTAASIGINNVKVSLPADQLNTNNELNVYQQVTDNIFAYADTSAVTSGVGTTNAAGGMLLTKYFINGTKQVYSTQAWIRGATTIGKEVYGVVIDNNGVVLDTTFHKIITAADTSSWVTFSFIHPAASITTNNNLYVGIAMVATGYFPVGFQTETPLRRYAFYTNGGLSTINLVESSYKLMIEATVGNPMDKDAAITQILNPATGCGLNMQSVTIKIKNEGAQTITAANGLVANYKIDNGTVVSQSVNADIAPLATLDFTFNTQANLPAPTVDVNYYLTTWVDLATDPMKLNDTAKRSITSGYVPPAPVANDTNVNYASTVTLVATPGSADTIIYWYQNLTDTAFFFTGKNYTTPVLYDTATYYIASGGGKANLKITELAINRGGTGATNPYPTWTPGQDLFEITNLGNAKVNLLGYKFKIYGTTGANSFTFPSVEVGAGQIVVLNNLTGTDDLANRYFNMGGTTDIQSASLNGYVLLKPDNTVVDAVATNSYVFLAGEASTSDWSGNIGPTSGLCGPIRVVSDNNVASDWVVSSAATLQTIGSLNPTLTAGTSSAGCQSSRMPIKAMISSFPAVDAGVTNLTLPTTPVNGGTSVPVVVKIKNYGMDVLTSATIGWSINGVVQTPFAWTGSLAHGVTSADVTISNQAVTLAGILSVKAWTYNPNAATDIYPTNDTTSGSVLVKFAGTYTIGTGSNFTSVDAVITALNAVGINDNVVFNILPGTYVTRPIINAIAGSGPTQTITFTSSTGDSTDVTLRYTLSSAAAFMMKFNGTSYMTFKNLTLSVSGSATWGRVIEIASSANHIEISNCVLIGMPKATATTTNFSTIFSSGAGLNYNIFKNNRFEGGYRCIEMIGVSGNTNKFNVISDNIFNDFNYSGSYTTYQDSMLITSNIYTNLSTAATTYSLYIANSNNFMVTKNKINRMGATGTNYGLYLATINSTSGNALVANNFVMQSGGTGISHGIYCSTLKNTRIFNNSVSIKRGTTASYAFYNTGSAAGANIQLLNNIFANTGGGYAYYASTNVSIDSSNYNCLYATGTNLAYWGAARTSLAALQAASGRDAYSISINPNFVDSTDLHATNVALPEKGTSVPEVTDDIDGQARGLFPTIGADEFLGTRTLNLTILLEGLYNGVDMRPAQDDMGDHWGPTIADVITIELHNAIDPTITEATFTNQSLNTNGSCIVTVPANLGDQYYIVIKHRNSVVTWSAIPMAFNTSIINYDFTTAASQAFGDNQKELGLGVYALFVGDVNQDEVIDLSDLVAMDYDLTNGTVDYVVYDLNGDGVVDLSDLVAIDVNLTNGIVALYP
jgi:hypothetical protein